MEGMIALNAYTLSVLTGHPTFNAIQIYGEGSNGKTYLIHKVSKKNNIDLVEYYSFEIKYKEAMEQLKTPRLGGQYVTGLHIIMTGKPNNDIKKLISVAGKQHPIYIESDKRMDYNRLNVGEIQIHRPSNEYMAKILGADDRLGKLIISLSDSVGSAKLNLLRFRNSPKGIKDIQRIVKDIDIDPRKGLGMALVNGYDADIVSKTDILLGKVYEVANLSNIVNGIVKSMKYDAIHEYEDKFWLHNINYNKRHGIEKKKKKKDDNIKFKKARKAVKKEEPKLRQRLLI